MDAPYEAAPADAVLVIGDRAMHPARGQWVAQWDLGDEWCRWAELPFVFAMWVAREGSGFRVQGSGGRGQGAGAGAPDATELSELAVALAEARDLGVAHAEAIARDQHAAYGLSYDDCLTYLRHHLHFTLGPHEAAALRLFRERAAALGLLGGRGATVLASQRTGGERAGTMPRPVAAVPIPRRP
jgi:chorismate dehydratase